MPRNALIVIPQLGFDPSSGAAQAMRTIGELLAARGFRVRMLQTSATEAPLPRTIEATAHACGAGDVRREEMRLGGTRAVVQDFGMHGVGHRVLDVGASHPVQWRAHFDPAFDELLQAELDHFRPEVLFTFGGQWNDLFNRWRARRRGIAVVLALHNLGYLNDAAFHDLDAVWACSPFVERVYREVIGVRSTALAMPVRESECVATDRQPREIAFVGATPEKGLMIALRVFDELRRQRPDIPIRVFPGRGRTERVMQVARSAGLPLDQHPNLTIAQPASLPSDIFARTRVVLIPSVWNEPGSRLAAEAALNGVPVVCSDRGGTSATAGEAAAEVIPVPREITPETDHVADPEVAAPWVEALLRLWDDASYEVASTAARRAGQRYRFDRLADAYAAFFDDVAPRDEGVIDPTHAHRLFAPARDVVVRERRSVLLMLSQMPQDPRSGAARSLRTMAAMLARRGFRVRALATTASDAAGEDSAAAILNSAGLSVRRERLEFGSEVAQVLRFDDAGVETTLLDVGDVPARDWPDEPGNAFDRLFDDMLRAEPPEVLLTFGGRPGEIDRRRRAHEAGATVVFGLRNHNYYDRRAFAWVDAVVTPSVFLSRCYRERIGLVSTPLPVPIARLDVVAEHREPTMLTAINPSRTKGAMLLVRLIDELMRRDPELPVMIVESRGTGALLRDAARQAGIDVRTWRGVRLSPGVARPRTIYAATRVLLVPSVWPEPSGRVAAEALVNGIPPVVSSRGGLAECCAGGGFVLGLPDHYTPKTAEPLRTHEVASWAALCWRLMKDRAYYEEASARAAEAGARAYDDERLTEAYASFFRCVRRAEGAGVTDR